jgi:hypothetical protein
MSFVKIVIRKHILCIKTVYFSNNVNARETEKEKDARKIIL